MNAQEHQRITDRLDRIAEGVKMLKARVSENFAQRPHCYDPSSLYPNDWQNHNETNPPRSLNDRPRRD